MPVYNFKKIQVVPGGKDLIDIILSRTNRKTPTIIHKGYAISRIRSFYMRKVKFTQQTVHDKLSRILEDFPILDEIHPFYEDLMNVLYNRDHYKLALGQINHCRHYIDGIAKDYSRLLKYGDSLYRCKQLKRAALGRMCTMLKKQSPNLAYLEQVRQHLSRLPSIDPNTRTLLLCGYPNVGKSSFINKITRADVDVQPYAFTTKSLFVGHTDYQYTRWQVIDTPGILDHPLEDRNNIEMQSITALAHLRAAVLFVIDLSEQCGYSLHQQISLFKSIKPLFSNKPLVLVANKIDQVKVEDLSAENKSLLDEFVTENKITMVPTSTLTEEGLNEVKEKACSLLLAQRVEMKMKGKQVPGLINRLHVATPRPRDNKVRESTIPQSVLERRVTRPQNMDDDEENEGKPVMSFTIGGPSAFEVPDDFDPQIHSTEDLRREYLLKHEDWKFDIIPEIVDGKNISDFIDPDIEELLDRLEVEEREQLALLKQAMEEDDDIKLTDEERALLAEVQDTKQIMIQESRMRNTYNSSIMPRKHLTNNNQVSDFEKHLNEMGIDPQKAIERSRSESRGRSTRRSLPETSQAKKRKRSELSASPGDGLRDAKQRKLAESMERRSQTSFTKEGKRGEADRHIAVKNLRHLLSGKRGIGGNQRR